MVEKILAIPSSITTSISLAALAIIVLYLVYKLFFENVLLPHISSSQAARLLGRIVNWVGVLALVALVLALAPPVLAYLFPQAQIDPGRITKENEISNRISAMLANFSERLYEDADRAADKVLELDPTNYRALNVKGSVAFYRADYAAAVKYFEEALRAKPGDRIITRNLADSYVETGGYQIAIDSYKSVRDGKPDWLYSMGRAYLFSEEFGEARKYLESVPTDFNRGAGRVLEAAALCGQAEVERDPLVRLKLISTARMKLREGIDRDPGYWEGILSGKSRDIHESHGKPKSLLEEIYGKA